MTASKHPDDESEESAEQNSYPYGKHADDPERGQPLSDGEHRPLTFNYPRPSGHGYRKLSAEYSPDSDEYPPEDDLFPEQLENSDRHQTDDKTDWSRYVAYFCRHCADECINPIDDDVTRMKECRDCFDGMDMTTVEPPTHHLPDDL